MNDEQSIFLAALEKTSHAERSAYLDRACGGDAALIRRIESLLNHHDHAGNFLEAPPQELARLSGDTHNEGQEDSFATTVHEGLASPSLNFLIPSDKPGCLGTIGQYEIESVLGRGGMGLVLKAHDTKLHRTVAVKVLAPELAAHPTARQRFLREARAAAAVASPHVITIHAVDETPLPHLVMEMVDGRTLHEKLAGGGMLEVKEILRIGSQIALGLAAAHRQGLIHRDVKPANILLENGVERVKITDFGLARAADDVSVTRTGEVAGTPQYMSPEQAEGRYVDHRSDLFSLGSVLYAMCAGRPPFRGNSPLSVLRRVVDETPRPIRNANPEIPEWLCSVIEKLLAKNPDDRYPSAAEVAKLLEDALLDIQEPNAGGRKPAAFASAKSRELPSRMRSRWTWGVAAGVVGAAVTLAGIGVLKERRATTPDAPRSRSEAGRLSSSSAASRSGGSPGPNRGLYFGKDPAGVTLPRLDLDSGGPFTIELWTTCLSRPETDHILMILGSVKLKIGRAPEGPTWAVYVSDPGVEPPWKVAAALWNLWPAGEPLGPTHLAFVREKEVLRLFINGRLTVQEPYTGELELDSLRQIGDSSFDGFMDEVRISNVARYAKDFLPPPLDERFEPDEHTVALYHFDEPSGEVAIDSSGAGRHGSIVGGERLDVSATLQQAGMEEMLTAAPLPAAPRGVSPEGANYALRFNTKPPASVMLGRLLMDEEPPYTVELQVACLSPRTEQAFLMVLGGLHLKINTSPHGAMWAALVRDLDIPAAQNNVIADLLHHWETGNDSPGPTHLAFVREKGVLRLFVNGRRVAQKLYSDPIKLHGYRRIGYWELDAAIDEVRISSIARYTEDFTPSSPTDRFEPDEHTVALYHFDEGEGRFALDSSGNEFHGEITGGEWIRVEDVLERSRKSEP
jgi:serine/threonine protein kinase